tara:strand:- start:333 stop:779 length:447 start_codon:yes stop_codon:yes gene_type:complete
LIKFIEHKQDDELIVDKTIITLILGIKAKRLSELCTQGIIIQTNKKGEYKLIASMQRYLEYARQSDVKNEALERRQEEKHNLNMAHEYLKLEQGKEALVTLERELMVNSIKAVLAPLQKFLVKLPPAYRTKARTVIKKSLTDLGKLIK